MTAIIPDGIISRAVREAIELRGKLITGGMLEPEADRIVGEGLQAAWVQSTKRFTSGERIWSYYCTRCHDTGWIECLPDMARLRKL